jgi:hypothetical protein
MYWCTRANASQSIHVVRALPPFAIDAATGNSTGTADPRAGSAGTS